MRLQSLPLSRLWVLSLALSAPSLALEETATPQSPAPAPETIPTGLFASLERFARLVDVTYCLGNTGVSKPFECISRCKDFPNLSLVTTWNTGMLLGDSCGFIAVDHGTQNSEFSSSKLSYDAGGPAIIVAFRGTYSLTNTVIDLSTVPQKYVPYPTPDNGGDSPPEKPEHECKNCTVHMGFLESWKNARRAILSDLKAIKEDYPTYPVQLIGHSLGGAVAALAALELKVSLGWQDVVATTFGEPRIGNDGFVRFVDEVFGLSDPQDLEERTYRRVTHQDDPVPLLPLPEWGYRSHAGEIFISKKDLSPSESDILMCVGDEDPNCIAGSDDRWGLLDRLRRLLHFRRLASDAEVPSDAEMQRFPARFKIWQLLFAHRDYFWRLGLCVPGGDPANWGRDPYKGSEWDEL